MPGLDDSRKYARGRGCRSRSLRLAKTFHSRGDHPLGSVAGGGFRGQRPGPTHAASRRQRLHRAGRRCHAYQAFGVGLEKISSQMSVLSSQCSSVTDKQNKEKENGPEVLWASLIVICSHGRKPCGLLSKYTSAPAL